MRKGICYKEDRSRAHALGSCGHGQPCVITDRLPLAISLCRNLNEAAPSVGAQNWGVKFHASIEALLDHAEGLPGDRHHALSCVYRWIGSGLYFQGDRAC